MCVFVFFKKTASAQVSADFTATPTQGCAPLFVQFTDQSTGAITSRIWDFGIGSPVSGNNPSPAYTYTIPGCYDITLTVSDGVSTNTITKSNYICAFTNPNAHFSMSADTGCTPFNVVFYDQTIPGNAGIENLQWAFGDGSDSTQFDSVSHTYTNATVQTVCMQATDSNGCSNIFCDSVLVLQSPVANFSTNDPTTSCTLPLSINFINNSTSATNYLWDFGDLNTSTGANPQYTYNTPGVYDVSLISSNNVGCSDTIIKSNFVQASALGGDIVFSNNRACYGENLIYTKVPSGDSAVMWNWPCCAITSHNLVDSIRFYPSFSGYQVVELILYGFGGCTDTIYDSVYVEKINVDFSSDGHYSCQTPYAVNFTDLSVIPMGISSWSWTFSDGSSSSLQNPNMVFNTSGDISVTLAITTNNGCFGDSTIPNMIKISEFKPTITTDLVRGCGPLAVQFMGGEQNNNTDSIQSWSWNFGDPTSGINNTSLLQNETHTFNDTGQYTVTLSVIDHSGCAHDTTIKIFVGQHVTTNFAAGQDSVCAKNLVSFFDLTMDSNVVNNWTWIWPDFSTNNTQNTTHQFTDTGYMSVTLISGHYGCNDTLVNDSAVYILAPIAQISFSVDCTNPLDISFQMTGKGIQRWYWDLGDGTPLDSVNVNPIHTYPSVGDYNVVLTAYNDSTGCDFIANSSVPVRIVLADFWPASTVTCLNNNVYLDATPSQDESAYTWNIEGDTNVYHQNAFLYLFQDTGFVDVQLIVTDINSCQDSILKTFDVGYIYAKFGFDTIGWCSPLIVNFTDSSFSEHGIQSWLWNFGNGNMDTVTNPTAIYEVAGTYSPSITITDSIGCVVQYIDTNAVVVFGPILNFSMVDDKLCEGEWAVFLNISSNMAPVPLIYEWNFGDGHTSTLNSPSNLYADTGFYNVTLIGYDPFYGCRDTLFRDSVVQVQSYPEAHFWASDTVICFNHCVVFNDSSLIDYPGTWRWNFGDFSSSNLSDSVIKCYTNIGTYDVRLIIANTAGCADTLIKPQYIEVFGPYAEFSISPDSICKGDSMLFVVDSTFNVTDYDWDFGDGQIETNVISDSIYHVYNQIGSVYLPKLIIYSDSLCFDVIPDSIFIHPVFAQFSVSDTIACIENANVNFVNESIGADSWNWDFGDASSIIANMDSLTHVYTGAGNYLVSLAIQNINYGCLDTSKKWIHVVVAQNLGLPLDTGLCLGDSILFTYSSSLVNSVVWHSPLAYLSDSIGDSIVISALQNTQIYFLLTDTLGCILRDTIDLKVFKSFQSHVDVPYQADTLIIVGTSTPILIETSGGGDYVYTWTPTTALSCESCSNPQANPLSTQDYTVFISDSLSCFYDTLHVLVEVLEEFKASVPTAFSPNGDGDNDVIYVKGWGIKQLLEYNIYNRWGELVYNNPGDINQGWDGRYKGEIQAQDSYAVTVKAVGYNNQVIDYKGFINIIR